ncbi:hypothetical protein [Aestuariivirga sp.]
MRLIVGGASAEIAQSLAAHGLRPPAISLLPSLGQAIGDFRVRG